MDKKGMGWAAIVSLILLVVFLWTGVKILAPILSEDFQFSIQEQVCRVTLGLNKYFDFAGVKFIEPLCSPQLITYNADLINKYKTKGETTKQASMRYLAEKMNRCQKIYNIESREGITQRKDCYICYALQADEKDPLKITFNQEEFTAYITKTQTPEGKSYRRGLQEEGHQYALAIKESILDLSKGDYGILYVDNVEVDDLYPLLGAGVVGATGTVCLISVLLAPVTGTISLAWCGGALIAAGAEGYVLKEELIGDTENLWSDWEALGGTNKNLVVVKELKTIESFCQVLTS